ncbi:MAG TPA: CDF family Co(II)/Ni(II) efflux transporter DmeF [Thiomonas arsenitoxydans]|jgi:Co/Zn/Cd efflux system component|uniref:Cation efflux family n=1 Tax=Thiomonas bhubaneswarensis TaxID=339866 RepID=A0A0K6IBR7_9BURK|nr:MULTISPECIES: CDF family Co(II)/Ni(II) efflux transporter DmeF [Thiomonas]MDE2254499.1 CDF family Co(II)/Ni(II) efflux transporter DmeF [Betaproteobacteria bacterium]OZB55704.1 MAG: cation transporter [Thiomonas sp. 15-63-373]CUB00767.1 Cation efflux family [Thiomonas bhubaneswarensis]HML81422.1 CDF family Co(II)/Ni(II) efflux transporter DmeF [Thiomonas arsenitoxydans]HOI67155.1 CDF family Co(II)/Ni(II) efflux transporter DmeF [Thiomonas arsenitoxydans]
MSATPFTHEHEHVFLGQDHDRNARKTRAVIALCTGVMVIEIADGVHFGSLALVADGLHMSTHAAAMLIAAMAYHYARQHAHDARFSFGTGKVGDLAGFSSAIILAMIALLIGYEAIARFIHPVAIDFNAAIAIAFLGLFVNILSAWLLSGNEHSYGHAHGHVHGAATADDAQFVDTATGRVRVEIHEDRVPPRFRLRWQDQSGPPTSLLASHMWMETIRPSGQHQTFQFQDQGGYWESVDTIPEPHAFEARLHLNIGATVVSRTLHFAESEGHDHGHADHHRDHNMRAAFVHVAADAAVSVLAIVGLAAGKFFGLNFMDPVMGIVGAVVIANWSFGLIRDTGAILLDVNPDAALSQSIRKVVQEAGDELADLHLWRLGPGHLGAIVAVKCKDPTRDALYYRHKLQGFRDLSHLTIEVEKRPIAL